MRRSTLVLALGTVWIAALAVPAAADAVYHSSHIPFAPIGEAPLRSGFVENIHANGPNVFAHEQYVVNGAEPNTTYDVVLTISILTQTMRARGSSLDQAAEAYAKVGIAVADAFICCWYIKYRVNLLRPVTYIRAHIDPAWSSLLVTPPFPDFTSGHSVQSGAAAQVMTHLFGQVAFTDHTHDDRGLTPRSFDSFDDAAAEAAVSRLYGGIHYRPAIDLGLLQGRCIGAHVSTLQLRG